MQDRLLYLECKSGISGDMTVACLLDLGVDEACFNEALKSLELKGVSWQIKKVNKNGIMATDFAVILADMPHQDEPENHEHHHEHHHHHHHESAHSHSRSHSHEHRNLPDILAIIGKSGIAPRAKQIAVRIFTILAEAEARVHGKSIDEVHFHEVGALDSIIDIVGAAVCLDYLDVNRVAISPLTEGSGFVMCQHGRLPVPVPATVEIAARYGIPLNITDLPYEMVTPTGIAIIAAIKTEDALPQNVVMDRIGYGAGKRDLSHANVLRGMLTDHHVAHHAPQTEQVWVLESNIDDSTGEMLGYAMEELLGAGALDVHYYPVFMKKNRPAWLLSVITKADKIRDLEAVIYRTTTTIGIRRHALERSFLRREIITVTTPYGDAKVKKCFYDQDIFYYPEYESVKALAKTSGKNVKIVMDEVRSIAAAMQA